MQMGQKRERGKFAPVGKIVKRGHRRLGADDRDDEGLTLPGNAVKSGGSGGAEIRVRKLNVKFCE